jgi:mannose-6-phosphate isomerase-like protein (cupin superfamily)
MKHLCRALTFVALLASPLMLEGRQQAPAQPEQGPEKPRPQQPSAQPAQGSEKPRPQQKPRPQAQGRGSGASSTLTVEVTDMSGNSIAGVDVAAAGPVDRSGRTEDKGGVVFRSMRAGTYRLRFEHDNFVTLEREVVLRAGQPASVAVALSAAPAKAEPAPEPTPAPETKPVQQPARNVAPRSLSLPDFLDKNLIGGEPQKTTRLACTDGSTTRLLQIRDPLNEQQHADLDEILYVVAGAGVVRMGTQETRMSPGHFALVPRGTQHSLRREGRNPLILLSVLAGAPCAETGAQ